MDVILLQRIKNLGKLGDKVSVKAGYGRNFLIPQAVAATEANTAALKLVVLNLRSKKLKF